MTVQRVSVDLDPDLHDALSVKSAETGKSVSDLVSDAVRLSLGEDAEDLAACRARAKEPGLDLEDVLIGLRRRNRG